MNKEEILAKSRNDSKKEDLMQVKNKYMDMGDLWVLLVITGIMLYKHHLGLSLYDTLAIFEAYMFSKSYPLYRFSGKRKHLISMLVNGALCLLFLYAFVERSLG